jgi:hypothetical protein
VSDTRTPARVRAGRENVKSAQAARAAKQAEADERAAIPATLTTTTIQDVLLEAVFAGPYRFLAMGGGIRGSKTWATLITLITLCRIYPRSRWAIVRMDLPTLKRNTIPSFNKLRETCSGFVGEINRTEWIAPCANGSEIVFFPESLQDDPELDRWRGLEVNGFLLEEANELSERTFHKAIERSGAWIVPKGKDGSPPVQPASRILCTFNPCDNWPRTLFYEPYEAGTLKPPYYYLPATHLDNPYVTDDQRENWEELPPAEKARFVEGDWGRIINPKQLIQYDWIRAATEVDRVGADGREAVDVARYGDDDTCFARIKGNCLVELTTYHDMGITEISTLAGSRLILNGIKPAQYRVDSVGVGAGVADNMVAAGHKIVEFVAGASAVDRRLDETPREKGKRAPESVLSFANLRSQAWWEAKEKLRLGQFKIPAQIIEKVPDLVKQLLAPEYDYLRDRVIIVDSKEKMKDKLGKSPNEADALIMAMFDLPKSLTRVFQPGEYAKSYVKW